MGRPVIRVSRPEQLGPAFKDLRRASDVTQQDVAEAVGMHPTHMGKYELAKVFPGAKRLLEILAAHDYEIALVPRERPLAGPYVPGQ